MLTRVAILWHCHQPDYRDPRTGRPGMPWVRLHALRGYRDLAILLQESGVPMTVNMVPSLIEQLQWYVDGGDDRHLELTLVPAAALDAESRGELLGSFVAGHPRMIGASPHYARLRALRDAGALTEVQDLRDLQVWSTLAWFGWSALRDYPQIGALREKGRGFTEADKRAMVQVVREICRELSGLYREASREGRGEISASPRFHPILPLLVDASHARRCMPELPEEFQFSWPGDALLQLQTGRAGVEQWIGGEVRGLWPSEGSVSPEVVALAAEAGFRWLVTDEEILKLSQRQPGTLYAPWDLGHGVTGFFRDRSLSDAIGFRYALMDPTEAAGELLAAVRARGAEARRGGRPDPVVTIALDGENPWETYTDAGEAFLEALCEGLRGSDELEAVTFSQATERPPAGQVQRLHTGSWIGARFDIWIGDAEDRAAWSLLAETRRAVAAAGDPPEALEHVLAAEGSDWFWWYGPEFSTPFDGEFDRLFRAHLAAAWSALGQAPPRLLSIPLKGAPAPSIRPPAAPISPRLSPGTGGFFDWEGAGYLDCARPGGAMSPGKRYLDGVAFGFGPAPSRGGARTLWLRLDRTSGAREPGAEWCVRIRGADGAILIERTWPEDARGRVAPDVVADVDQIKLALAVDGPISARVALRRDGFELARYPAGEPLHVRPVGGPRWDWMV